MAPEDVPPLVEDRDNVDTHTTGEPEFAFGPDDHLATAVIESAKKAKGVARLDFGTIFGLIKTVMELLGSCPFARARQAMRDGDSSLVAGAFKAARDSGEFTPREAVAFAIDLQARAKAATEEQAEPVLSAAQAFGRRAVIVLVLGLGLLGGAAHAQAVAATSSGPFGRAVTKGTVLNPPPDPRAAEIDNMKRTIDALRKDLNIALNMNDDLKNEVTALRYEIKARVPKTADSAAWSKNDGSAWTPPTETSSTAGLRHLWVTNSATGWRHEARERADGYWNVGIAGKWVVYSIGADGRMYPYGLPANRPIVQPAQTSQSVQPVAQQRLVAARRG